MYTVKTCVQFWINLELIEQHFNFNVKLYIPMTHNIRCNVVILFQGIKILPSYKDSLAKDKNVNRPTQEAGQ